LIDARVSGEVIQFYRALISEAKGKTRSTSRGAKQGEPDLPAGAITRLNAAVPETIAQIQHLERELLAQAEARHKREVEELSDHLEQTQQLLHAKSISLAKSEAQVDELRNRLRKQLQATKKLARFLDESEDAADRLRDSACWQIANPVAAIKAKLSPQQSRDLLGYGHLEKIVAAYQKW